MKNKFIGLIGLLITNIILASCPGFLPGAYPHFRLKDSKSKSFILKSDDYSVKISSRRTHHIPLRVEVDIKTNRQLEFYPGNLKILYNDIELTYSYYGNLESNDAIIITSNSKTYFGYDISAKENEIIVNQGKELKVCAENLLFDGDNYIDIDTLNFIIDY
ncbi:MAG: hypothetical protein JSU85_09045 [Candidatus Zixiibacteriota bacterium]|nr:MAG: hypothetical protein JSU85_09045 [candidate division Zixibacteria bacterium]